MSRRAYGIIASVLGSAVGAWWWNRRRGGRNSQLTAPREQGTVIFNNTPAASDLSGEGII